jgi:hypothetical protein
VSRGAIIAPVGTTIGKKQLWAMLESLPQLDDVQRKFLILVARGESGWNPLVGLGDPSLFPAGTKPNTKASAGAQENEARAARVAFERHAADFEACGIGHSEQDFGFGSGGWFGMLPANGIWQLRDTPFRCWPPAAVFDPARALTMAIAFARGLQGWDGFKANPTVYNLRAGWGIPTSMGNNVAAERIAKYRKHAQESGLPSSFVDETIAHFPGDYVGIYQTLAAGAVASSSSDASQPAANDGSPDVLEPDYDLRETPPMMIRRADGGGMTGGAGIRGERQRIGAPVSYRNGVAGAFEGAA